MVMSYQPLLAQFVRDNQLHTLVETGLGESTVQLLGALDAMGEGHLTSVDPAPWWYGSNGKIQHPRHTHVVGVSCNELWKVPGPWDLFLHDSDHDCLIQTLEFHFAWGMLRKGGWLVVDDCDWGQHGAWRQFLKQRGLTATKMDSVEMVQKIFEPIRTNHVASYFSTCLGRAQEAERTFLANGGQNTAAFAENRKEY
jgi:predicted O-methyltransferase YrrM